MTVIIIETFYVGDDYTENRTEYQNVTNCRFKYQPQNEKSYWLFMEKAGKNDCFAVEIDIKHDEIYFYQD